MLPLFNQSLIVKLIFYLNPTKPPTEDNTLCCMYKTRAIRLSLQMRGPGMYVVNFNSFAQTASLEKILTVDQCFQMLKSIASVSLILSYVRREPRQISFHKVFNFHY